MHVSVTAVSRTGFPPGLTSGGTVSVRWQQQFSSIPPGSIASRQGSGVPHSFAKGEHHV